MCSRWGRKGRLKVDGYPERAKLVPGYEQFDQAFVSQWRTHFKDPMREAPVIFHGADKRFP
jgi:hypothetical protein